MRLPASLFLSYSNTDLPFALWLAAGLKNAGVHLWVDQFDARPDENWAQALPQAMTNSRAALVILSPAYFAARYCQRELDYFSRAGRPMISVLLQPFAPSEASALIGYPDIDFSAAASADDAPLAQLLDLLHERQPTAIGAAPASDITAVNRLIAQVGAALAPTADAQAEGARAAIRPARIQPIPVRKTFDPQAVEQVTETLDLLSFAGDHPRFMLTGNRPALMPALAALVLDASRAYLCNPRAAPLPLLIEPRDWAEYPSLEALIRARAPLTSAGTSRPRGLHLRDQRARREIAVYFDLSSTALDARQQVRLRRWLKRKPAPARVVLVCAEKPLPAFTALAAVEWVGAPQANAAPALANMETLLASEGVGEDVSPVKAKKWDVVQFLRKIFTRKKSSSGSSSQTVKGRLQQVVRANNPTASAEAEVINDFDWVARSEAALSLVTAPPEVAVPRLITTLNDEDAQVRIAAVNTLMRFKDDVRVIPALMQALRDDDFTVVDAAASALIAIARAPIPGLINAIHNTNLNVRAAAIEVSGAVGEKDAVPDIIEALSDLRKIRMSDERICDAAAKALDKLATPEALEAVSAWRAANDNPIRQSFTETQTQRDVLGELLRSLHNQDWEARQEGAKLLREFAQLQRGKSDPAVLTRLIAALDDPDWAVRGAVIEALAWVKDKSAVTPLVARVSDPNWMVRAAALRALIEIGDKSAVSAVAPALKDEKSAVREAAVEALGALGDGQSVSAVGSAVGDSDPMVRLAAADALGNLRDPAGIDPLKPLLREEDPAYRWYAANALRKIGDARAVPLLIPLLEDTDCPNWEEKRICDVAALALEAINTPEARAALNTWKQ